MPEANKSCEFTLTIHSGYLKVRLTLLGPDGRVCRVRFSLSDAFQAELAFLELAQTLLTCFGYRCTKILPILLN